ncbi:hypothetical protein HT031_001187 [Scenedesmus sp. PABB004]|nr:hypothetical protein HT031_001187 [Scenedesmus sp. PABB004]
MLAALAAGGLASPPGVLAPLAAVAWRQLGPCVRAAAQARQRSTSTSAPPVAGSPASSSPPRAPLDFDDYRSIFSMRSTGELLRMYGVLQVCSITPLVRNADALVRASRRVLGDAVTFGVMRHTFMAQFCAGEAEADLWPTIAMLRASGIGAIIDFAAEDDVAAAPAPAAPPPPPGGAAAPGAPGAPAGGVAVGRTYSYEGEAVCDKHVDIFLKAIDTVAKLPGTGFAAIKARAVSLASRRGSALVTALGNPLLLERMSGALLEIRRLFREADADGDGFVDRREFGVLYEQLFPGAPPDVVDAAFATLDLEAAGRVDIVSWSHRIRLADMPAMVQRIRDAGTQTRLSDELVSVALTAEEVGLVESLLSRVGVLAERAAGVGVKLMVDAEHTYFQPAIDHTTHVLSLAHNRGRPVIFNTYQAYLTDSFSRLAEDMERARREGYVFAAKLVRGAYLQLERARAARLGVPSPIWPDLEATHANYNRCLDALLDEVSRHGAQVMVASHNQASIERTVAGMAARGLAPAGSGVYFGQLLGMSDNLTFTLGQAGYEAFKYTPYGPIQLVMPYLIRRAHENSAIMGAGVAKQMAMLRRELARRLRSAVGLGGGAEQAARAA